MTMSRRSGFNCGAGRGRLLGIPRVANRNHALKAMISFVMMLSFLSSGANAEESTVPSANLSFADLEMCSDSSYNVSKYGAEDVLPPCILYDLRDTDFADKTSEVTLVQVTPHFCHNHRDGAFTAVKHLNANNEGMGIPIGYNQDHYVKLRLVSIVGGNTNNIDDATYKEAHSALLDSVFEEIDNAHYIIGSCSQQSATDKPIALKRGKVVLSQVGPPGFYMDIKTNPYVFGIHVNSDTYPLPALQALQFHLKAIGTDPSLQPVRVIYRDKSEFFYSTCRSVIDEAIMQGFDVTAIEYDPFAEEDGSGVPNNQNVPFIQNLTDILCPAIEENSTDASDGQLPPALFACVVNEIDPILERMRSNGCRPSLSWFTPATWGWASNNGDAVPYFQGAGQWHKNFKYSDQFFDSGQDVLNYGLDEFGYIGSYDHVVSYAVPNLIADLIQSFFRIDDFPNVTDAFSNRYEDLRKALLYIKADTIFGPVSFNKYQRNDGRGGAGMQWIPSSYVDSSLVGREESDSVDFVLGLMSPFDQADAGIIIPTPSGSKCYPGSYVNRSLIEVEASILGNKCSVCPVDEYTSEENSDLQCIPCPMGSSTNGEVGATECLLDDPNLIPTGLKSLGYIFVVISWSLAVGYIVWMIMHKDDSVIKIGQPEFLLFICIGAIISSSTIIPLTLAEADVGEDTAEATRYCQSIPFLYSLGWVLMYSSLTAKSYRLTKIAAAASRMNRLKITANQMYKIIIAFMALDLIILIAWQFTDPLVYTRTRLAKSVDEDTGVVTMETIGQCSSDSLWKFLGPIIGIHVCLMVITNVLLWRVRNMSDRYQEQKFVALASVYICELLLLGIPILIAVQDSAAARYMVMAGVIFLTDTGVLSLIFIPKIKFQNEGLPQGVSVAQSLSVRRTIVDQRSRYGLQSSNDLTPSRSKSTRDYSGRDYSGRDVSRNSATSSVIVFDDDEEQKSSKHLVPDGKGSGEMKDEKKDSTAKEDHVIELKDDSP